MSTVLLDTNAIIWFTACEWLEQPALVAIAAAQSASNVLISPISVWEAALALRKPNGRPNLGGSDAAQWFRVPSSSPASNWRT